MKRRLNSCPTWRELWDEVKTHGGMVEAVRFNGCSTSRDRVEIPVKSIPKAEIKTEFTFSDWRAERDQQQESELTVLRCEIALLRYEINLLSKTPAVG